MFDVCIGHGRSIDLLSLVHPSVMIIPGHGLLYVIGGIRLSVIQRRVGSVARKALSRKEIRNGLASRPLLSVLLTGISVIVFL